MNATPTVVEAGHYFQWGVVQISLANLLVIVAMIIVFILALVLPFPHSKDRSMAAHRSMTPVADQKDQGDPDDR